MKGYFKINLVYVGGNFVAIVGFINLILFLVSTNSFSQEIELPNDPLVGQKVFQNKECVNCHAVHGKGGRIGRDLGKTHAQRGPAGIVAMMWNHSPEMNQAMQKPQEMSNFSEQEMADLLAYIYFLSYLDDLGEPEKGQTVLKQKACLTCHKVGGEGGEVGPPLDKVRSYANPLSLVQEMWNHGIRMSATMAASGIQRPAFTGSEVVDLFAYLREISTYQADEGTYLTPGKPKIGERLFEKKNCLQCHKIGTKGNTVGPDLTQKKFHIGVTQIAAEMWNHGPKIWEKMKEMKIEQPTFQGNEMADLVSYLYFLDFVQLRGDTEMGKVVYVKKGCVECHSVRGRGGNVAIDLARSDKTQNYVKAATAMWNHNRRMRLLMKKVGVVMPRFNENEMENLLAYLSALNK